MMRRGYTDLIPAKMHSVPGPEGRAGHVESTVLLSQAMSLHNAILIYTLFPMSPSGSLQTFKAEFFKALGHPVRIRILEILVAGDRTVQDLQDVLALDQPTVSQQLAILRARNIVTPAKIGSSVRYTVRDPLVGDLLAVARRIFNNHLTGTESMLRELRREPSLR